MSEVALYARVSTRQHGQNPETQLIPLRDFAKARGFAIATEYVDVGWSGSKERRPQLDRMMMAARRHHFTAVLVWRFDRFARSTKHLLTALSEFQSLGIDFISTTESIDSSTPVGQMVFTILAAVAQMERELIRERVQAGVDRARREGKKLGRPTVDVDREQIRRRIGCGESISSIARSTGIARSTVRAIWGSGGKTGRAAGDGAADARG